MPVADLLIFGLLRFGVSAFEEAQKLTYLRTKEVAYHEIACRTFTHLHQLSLHWHISKRSGVVLRAMDRGINSASVVVDMLFLRLVPTLVEMAVLVAIFTGSYNSANSAIVLAAGFGAYIVVTIVLTRWRRKARMKQHRTDNEANSIAVESLQSFETVKAFGNEGFELGRYSAAIKDFQAASRSSAAAVSILNILQSGIIRATVTGVLLVAGLDVLAGRTSIGDFVALQVYVVSLFTPLSWLGSMFSLIIQSITDMRNLVDLLLEVPEPRDAPGAGALVLREPSRGATIEFRGVTFAYPSSSGAPNRIEAQMLAQQAREGEASGGRVLLTVRAASSRVLRGVVPPSLRRRWYSEMDGPASPPPSSTAAAGLSTVDGGSVTALAAVPQSGKEHFSIEMNSAWHAEAHSGSRGGHAAGGGVGKFTLPATPTPLLTPVAEGAPSPAATPSASSAGGPRIVLRDVSFTMRPGTTTALVGHTGSGKSSIARLLFRFYDLPRGSSSSSGSGSGSGEGASDGAHARHPSQTRLSSTDASHSGGAVVIDGHDIRDVTQASLRGHIGVVPQETLLFNDSMAYNIKYGRPEASDADMVAAAEAAQLGEFVKTLKDGYNTKVGERGLKLSGGEKQRVAIARAILKNPPILILDEATSALDTLTEAAVQTAISSLRAGRTVLVIAHRLSTVKDADEIIVLDGGSILERGTHEQLLGLRGKYADMWHQQSEALRKVAEESAAVPPQAASEEGPSSAVPGIATAAPNGHASMTV